ncbi:MAG TPA: hydrogenase 4 subunit B [Thermaerobacter sp.]
MAALQLLMLSIVLYAVGAVLSLTWSKARPLGSYVAAASTLMAALAGLGAAATVLAGGQAVAGEFPSVVPFARFSVELDALSALVLAVLSLLAAATAIYSLAFDRQFAGAGAGVLGFLNNVFILSLVLVVASANAFYFLVFWEIMTLASFFLVAYRQDREAIHAGILYFAVGHVAAAALIVSFVILFLHAGSFDFAAIRDAQLPPAVRHVVFALTLLGFGVKAGVVPFHFWLPPAYAAAPATMSALMSSKVAVYAFVRVGLDVLRVHDDRWGLFVLALGGLSALLGALYAVNENNLNRLLAYSSTENVGIMLMGIGAGMIGAATGNGVLAGLGILAGVFHLVNHAVFKGLLFLGTGAVTCRLGTASMQAMGGLIKRMPWTAAAFLTGAMAISAIPPLNGFVSEWFVYQSLFAAGASDSPLVKGVAPLAAAILALAGALAAMAFVKAFGITFTGPARGERARQASEVPGAMVAGMVVLAAGCAVLGLGAPAVGPYLARAASTVVEAAPITIRAGLAVVPGAAAGPVISTPLVALLLGVLAALAVLVAVLPGGSRSGRRVDESPWACGYAYSHRMAYTSAAFAQPLRVLFRSPYSFQVAARSLLARLEVLGTGTMRFLQRVEPVWERWLYRPVASGTLWLGRRVQSLQMGNVRVYGLYLIVALIVLLLSAAR